MKSFKKALVMLLVLALVLGTMATGFAAAPSDVTGTKYEAAVTKLMGLGVVNGFPDGTYKPNEIVTRAQMAKLIVISMGLQSAADIAKGVTMFSDVTADHWASGYINVAADLGIIKGYPDGTFKPENTVTYPEALTMLVRALGYKDSDLTGTWPTNYIVKASSLGLAKDVTITLGGANRGDVALMVMNTLNANMKDPVKYENNQPVYAPLLSKIATEATYTVLATPEVNKDVPAGKVLVAGKQDPINAGSVNFNDYLGKKVTVYEKDGVPVTVAKVTGDVMTVTASLDSVAGKVYYDKDENNKNVELAIDTNAKMIYNGTYYDFDYDVVKKDSSVTLVDWDADKDYDYAIVKYYDAPVVVTKDVAANATKIYTDGGDKNLITDSNGKVDLTKITITINGNNAKLEDIKTNDVLYIAKNKDTSKMELRVVRNVVTGKYTELKTDKYVIGGIEYSFYGTANTDLLGKDVKALLGDNNKVVKLLNASTGTTQTEYYAYLIKKAEVRDAFNTVIGYQVKLVKTDGTTVTMTVNKDAVGKDINWSTLQENTFVKYSVNSSNEIITLADATSELTIVNGVTVDSDNNKITVGSTTYYITSDTVVFNVYNNDIKVIKFADYNYSGQYNVNIKLANTLNDLKYLIFDANLSSKTIAGTKVFVKSVSQIAGNGSTTKARFYVTKLDGTSAIYDSTVDYGTFNKGFYTLTIDKDGKVTDIQQINMTVNNGEVKAKSSTRINIADTVYELASDVVVFDKDGNKVTLDSIVVKDDYTSGSTVKALVENGKITIIWIQ